MECEFCEKVFTSKTNLQRHQKTVASCLKLQGKILTGHICDYCNGSYAEKSGLSRHLLSCKAKRDFDIKQNLKNLKIKYNKKIFKLEDDHKNKANEWKKERKRFNLRLDELEKIIKEKDNEITELKVKCEADQKEVYNKVCTKVLDKSTVTNNTNTAYFHSKLVNLPITNIHPLTSDYVKEQVADGNYTFDHYLKGENGLVDFIYSITMCENNNGAIERNYVCTDPSRDSYHRLVETKEWQKDKGGKFVDVILDTLSDKADDYHMKLFDERKVDDRNLSKSKKKLGYDPDYIYKLNTDMHSGIVQSDGKDRKILRQKIKKETSRKISV
jgi:hypothetical protein